MTAEMIACCGLDCSACPAYIAKRTDDDELRKKTAEEWSQPGYTVPYQDVNCDGCTSEGEFFKHWCLECPVRLCVKDRELENCAYCDDYVCDKLESVFKIAGNTSRERLEQIRNSL